MNEEQIMNLQNELKAGRVVNVEFEKANGDLRKMRCVGYPEAVGLSYDYKTEGVKNKKDGIESVWDLEKDAWRSFKLESVVNWSVEND